ncbi:MAG: hypothetical protein N2316_11385 [Spirochaetes bacterium]|nr:hypothetical protein [Spirochaetota bacterium]
MRRYVKYLSVLLFFYAHSVSVSFAEEASQVETRMSVGAGISGEYCNFIDVAGGTVEWKGGVGYAFGFVAEYAGNDFFSVQSGFWYGVNFIDLTMQLSQNQMSDTIEARTEFWILPFYFIFSYTIDSGSIGAIAGINFMHIRKSEFRGTMGTDTTLEITEYLNYDQYGPVGGIQIKIGISRYVQVFVQGLAEVYAKKFITAVERTAEYLYDYRAVGGILLKMY